MDQKFRLALLAMFAVLIATPPTAIAQTRPLDFKPLNDRRAEPAKSEKTRRKACSEYGAGFYKMEGSDTCVRIGGGIDVTVSSGRGLNDAPPPR